MKGAITIALAAVLVFAVATAPQPAVGADAAWEQLLTLDCRGGLHLATNSILSWDANGHTFKLLADHMRKGVQNVASCACSEAGTDNEFETRIWPGVKMLMNFLGGADRTVTNTCTNLPRTFWSNSIYGYLFGADRDNQLFKFSLPSTCTEARWEAGNGCQFQVHETVSDTQFQFSFDRCPDNAAFPFISLSCSGPYCAKLLAPCDADADCGSNMKCNKLFTAGDIASLMEGMSMISDKNELTGNGCTDTDFMVKARDFLASFFGTSPTGTAQVNVCIPTDIGDKIGKELADSVSFSSNDDYSTAESTACIATGCNDLGRVGDGKCDGVCNNDKCYFDGGDCAAPDLDKCPGYSAGQPCSGKGRCDDSEDSNGNTVWQCSCNAGYTGTDCGTKVTACYANANDAAPCSGNGYCSSSGSCSCTGGYKGTHCETQITECFANGKLCNDYGSSCPSYGTSCTDCVNGYAGAACQTKVDACYENTDDDVPCNSHGTCQADGSCVCEPGWTGAKCATMQTSCPSDCNSSNKQGQCRSGNDGLQYCACVGRYSGSDCGTVVDSTELCPGGDCSGCPTGPNNEPCSLNGHCTSSKSCSCASGFYGSSCQYKSGSNPSDTCSNDGDCDNGGACSSGGIVTFATCSCEAPYYGSRCWSKWDGDERSNFNNNCGFRSNGGTCKVRSSTLTVGAISAWDGNMASGTVANSADRKSGFDFSTPEIAKIAPGGGTTMTMGYHSCFGEMGFSPFQNENLGLAMQFNNAPKVQNWFMESMIHSAQDCRAAAAGKTKLSDAQFQVRFITYQMAWMLYQIDAYSPTFDLGNDLSDYLIVSPLKNQEDWNSRPVINFPESCDFNDWMATGKCGIVFDGLSQLLDVQMDVAIGVGRCPGDFSSSAPKGAIAILGPLAEKFASIQFCSTDADCGSGSKCENLGKLIDDAGADADFMPGGYMFPAAYFLRYADAKQCATRAKMKTWIRNLLQKISNDPVDSSTDLAICAFDPESVTTEEVSSSDSSKKVPKIENWTKQTMDTACTESGAAKKCAEAPMNVLGLKAPATDTVPITTEVIPGDNTPLTTEQQAAIDGLDVIPVGSGSALPSKPPQGKKWVPKALKLPGITKATFKKKKNAIKRGIAKALGIPGVTAANILIVGIKDTTRRVLRTEDDEAAALYTAAGHPRVHMPEYRRASRRLAGALAVDFVVQTEESKADTVKEAVNSSSFDSGVGTELATEGAINTADASSVQTETSNYVAPDSNGNTNSDDSSAATGLRPAVSVLLAAAVAMLVALL